MNHTSMGAAGATPGWMHVRVGGADVALPIERVGEVLPIPQLSPVPMAPVWVVGIISVRGEVVAVVDAGLRLRGRATEPEGRLILTNPDDAGERVGLLVDAVAGLIDRKDARVEAKAKNDGAIPARFTVSSVTERAEPVAVLDLGALLDPTVATGEPAAG